MLIGHGANVNARQQDHWTPIHLSARNGHLGILKLLLERGADLQALNDEGETPYQLSLTYGYRKITDFLQQHGTGRERLEVIFFCKWISDLTSILVLSFDAA